MKNNHQVQQSPEEKFEAIGNIRDNLAEKFLELGQLLSDIKSAKLYLFKGYENFNSFLAGEYNLSTALANKLIRIQMIFIDEMDMDEEDLLQIGYDRLGLICAAAVKADWATRDELVSKARELPLNDLKAHLKALREEEKKADPDLKKLLVDQFKERLCTNFNCSWSEAQFKLALWFSIVDVESMRDIKAQIKTVQQTFESTLSTSSTPSTSPEAQ